MNKKEQIAMERTALEARLKVLEEAVKQKKKDDKAEMRRMKELKASVEEQKILEKIREQVGKDVEMLKSMTKVAAKWRVTRDSIEKVILHQEGANVVKKLMETWVEMKKEEEENM